MFTWRRQGLSEKVAMDAMFLFYLEETQKLRVMRRPNRGDSSATLNSAIIKRPRDKEERGLRIRE